MEKQIITPNNPTNNTKNAEQEYNNNHSHILKQINNFKETFSAGFHNIENDFIKSYNIYSQELSKKILEYDKLIDHHIESANLKNQCYLQINTLLEQKIKDNINNYNKYLAEIVNTTQKFLDLSISDDFSKVNNFINSSIEAQLLEKEKEKQELNKKFEIEEKKKKFQEEHTKIKQTEENFLKRKNISKIEINGEEEESANIYNIEAASTLNWEKIIITKMSKERFELLFSKKYSLYCKLHNQSNLNDNMNNLAERTGSIYSISGEPAPGVVALINNQNNIDETTPKGNNKSITDISLIESSLEDINFVDYFPYIDNLKIINSKLSYNIAENLKYGKLDTLKLEGVKLINENFNALFEQLRTNIMMRKNLRIFSVKNNNISFLDYKKGYADNILKSMSFTNLEFFDLSYNRIYLFQNQIFNSLENIKVIDLTYNNIAFPSYFKELLKSAKSKKCLVLMAENLAILKENANIEYNNYLIQILKEFNYPLQNLALDNIFCQNNYQDLFKIEIGQFKNSLQYLNLSNNQLKDNDLISLLEEKWDLTNLEYFTLDNNNLTEKFIYAFIDKEYNFDKKFSKLKILKLSYNPIKCSDVFKYKQFLQTYKNIQIIELKYTPIEKCINQFFKKKVMKFHDPGNVKQSAHAYNDDEKKIEQIFDDKALKEKTTITIKIMDLIYSKYTKTIYTHLSYLVDRITLENKFIIINPSN